MTGDIKTTEQESISMDAFALMCDLQTHNLTQSALWSADVDLSKVRSDLKGIASLEKACKLLEEHLVMQEKMGVVHYLVDSAASLLYEYVSPMSEKLKKEEEYLTGHMEKLRQELDDLAKERKQRAKKKKGTK